MTTLVMDLNVGGNVFPSIQPEYNRLGLKRSVPGTELVVCRFHDEWVDI